MSLRQRGARPSTTEALARLPLFKAIEPAVRDQIAAHARVVSRAAGGVVVAQGVAPDAIFGIVRGRVKVALGHATGASSTIGVLGPGDICGELGVLGAARRAAEVTALDDVMAVRIPGDCFLAALEASPRLGLALSRMLASRVRTLAEHFGHVAALDAHTRVARKLLILAERFGRADGGVVVIDLPITQQDIAELAEVSRQRANVVLQKLARGGITTRAGRRIVVRDLAKLRTLAASGQS